MTDDTVRRAEHHQAEMEALRERTGRVTSSDPLVSFLYLLMRDRMTVGDVEQLVLEISADTPPAVFTNGHLARYAKDLAARLRKDGP